MQELGLDFFSDLSVSPLINLVFFLVRNHVNKSVVDRFESSSAFHLADGIDSVHSYHHYPIAWLDVIHIVVVR